jgi:hypothetical protein
MKTFQKEFELQEAVTTIGVQHIIDSIEEQYVKELNKDYFGYANQTIKMLLTQLHIKWCNVMTKERTTATEAFYQAWVPSTTHIITFGHQLDKQQKKCKNINVIISEEAKTLHFVGQIYKSNYYTKEQMTKYKMKADINKPGSIPYSSSPNLLPNTRHTETTMWQTLVLAVQRTPKTSQPIAALSPPPVTSPPVTSTLIALRNYLRQHWSMLQRDASLPRTNRTQRTYYPWNLMPNAKSLTSS